MPVWYTALKKIVTATNFNDTIVQVHQVQQLNLLALTKRTTPVSTKRSKKEWIVFKHGSSVTYGHITEKSNNLGILTVQHWTMNPISIPDNPLTISLCTSCPSSTSSNCSIRIRSTSVLTTITTPKASDSTSTKYIQLSIDDYALQGLPTHNRITRTDLHAIKSLDTPIVHIQPQHIHSITTLISQPTIANNLTRTALLLFYSNQRSFRLYTDGSLQPSITTSNGSPILGAAWVIPSTEHHPDLYGKVATINWPSSTRAELLAIWTGLLVIPPQATVDLFTDSQAAIDSINKSLSGPSSPRQWLKTNNDSIISNIRHRINTLYLSVKLHKIKGHSGNEYNEMADNLAKQVVRDAKNNPSLILDINNIQQGLRFGPKWNGTYTYLPKVLGHLKFCNFLPYF